MHWVYVLECEDNRIYVGETKRLFRRWNEHQNGLGGINTSTYEPTKIIGLYKVSNYESFSTYDYFAKEIGKIRTDILKNWGSGESYKAREYEDFITLSLMKENGDNWNRVIGGSYCQSFRPMPAKLSNFETGVMCKCRIPAEINYSKGNDFLYYNCSRWGKEYLLDNCGLDYDYPCNFWQKYTGDEEAKRLREERQRKWVPPRRSYEEVVALFKEDA